MGDQFNRWPESIAGAASLLGVDPNDRRELLRAIRRRQRAYSALPIESWSDYRDRNLLIRAELELVEVN